MTHRKQARFWIMAPHGGLVRIKLNPNTSVTHCTAWNTDEGWSSEAHAWSFDGHIVHKTFSSDGVDCDGRLQRFGEAVCPLDFLHAGSIIDGVAFPAWEHTLDRQRDFAAEAAGY